uniref:Lipid droplet-associated hydrolase n=1 Tax=Caenorhabditis tropicalis TaxID=1561998 RepID=A0A1I7USA5_9PELO
MQHKLDFVKEYLPRGNRVYMFGHGAGAYMLLSILPYIKDDFNLRKAVCLFPTIEKMNESPHGIRLRKVVSNCPELVDSISELLHMHVFRNIVHLCNDELEKIGTLDETLLFHKNLIYFYYGTNDGWCPIEQGNQMNERLARGHVVLEKDSVEHSFVFRDAATMAEKVLQFIV